MPWNSSLAMWGWRFSPSQPLFPPKTGGICQVFPFSTLPPSLVFQKEKEKGKAEQGKKLFFPDPPSMYVYALLCTPPRLPQKRKNRQWKVLFGPSAVHGIMFLCPSPPSSSSGVFPALFFSLRTNTHTPRKKMEKNLPLRVSVFPQKSRFFYSAH